MIVCVSCDEDNSSETLCSLNFAARARNVTLGPAKCKATGASEAKLRERERELEAARDVVRKMEAAAQDMSARLAAADSSHEKVRAALERQVEELQGESRAQLKKVEQLKLVSDQLRDQLQAARSSEASAGAGEDASERLTHVAEGQEIVMEEVEAEQVVGSGGAGEGHKGEGDVGKDVCVGRWAHPTLSTLAAKSEGVSSPRGARKMNKALFLGVGNKENSDVAAGGAPMSSPRVRRPELCAPALSQNKSAAPACASKPKDQIVPKETIVPKEQTVPKPLDKTDRGGAINDRLESRLAAMRTANAKPRDSMSSLPAPVTADKASTHASPLCSSTTSGIKGVPARKECRYGEERERLAILQALHAYVLPHAIAKGRCCRVRM
jgi:hypothetical protein